MPAFPGSSFGRFSTPSKAVNRGDDKNPATLSNRSPPTSRFPPLAFLTAVLLWLAIWTSGNYKTYVAVFTAHAAEPVAIFHPKRRWLAISVKARQP